MKIDMAYQSAIDARNQKQLISNTNNTNPLAGKEFDVIYKEQSFKLTISSEMIEFQKDNTDFFSLDINVKNANPSDPFSYKPRDQWLVFSQYLNDSKFFDSLDTDDISKIESTFQQITEGLDSLTQTGGNVFGGLKTQLDSYEAKLEFISSTSALQLFSEKFLTEDVRKGFDQLIDQYVSHNKDTVMNYKSIEENFYEARSKINSINNVSLTSEHKQMLSLTNKLGQTNHSQEEIDTLLNSYSGLFTNIKNEDNLTVSLLKAKEQLVQFVTKGFFKNDNDYEASQDFISERTNNTFNRIENYWKSLLQ